jgi:hypothetical protein
MGPRRCPALPSPAQQTNNRARGGPPQPRFALPSLASISSLVPVSMGSVRTPSPTHL